LATACGKVDESSAICGLDEEVGCIRKYPSKCHLDIAACQEKGKSQFIYLIYNAPATQFISF